MSRLYCCALILAANFSFSSLADTSEIVRQISRFEADDAVIVTLVHVEYEGIVKHLGKECKVVDERIYVGWKGRKSLIREARHYRLNETVDKNTDAKHYWKENDGFLLKTAFSQFSYLYPQAVLKIDSFLFIYCVTNGKKASLLVVRMIEDDDNAWSIIKTYPSKKSHDFQPDELISLSLHGDSIKLESNKFTMPRMFLLSDLIGP